MTIDFPDPWAGIDTPSSGYKITRVDPDHPQDFFWGKDFESNYLLLLEIDSLFADFLENKTIELRGVKADIRHIESKGEFFFLLCLQNKKDADIFFRLCVDLIERTKEFKEKKIALELILTRLNRWKAFLSRKRSHLLSDKEVRGLFAELEFLYEYLLCINNHIKVIEGWQGPLDGPHDYVMGDYAVEVKSVSGSQKNTVRISSENQLITHLDNLYLHVIFLAEFHDCKKGTSLNQMIEKVRTLIVDADARDLFDSRLYETGYMDLKDYDIPCFSITAKKTFIVREGFPRIIPEDLCDGVEKLTYDLNLNSLENFVCELPE